MESELVEMHSFKEQLQQLTGENCRLNAEVEQLTLALEQSQMEPDWVQNRRMVSFSG
jgi:hypothetical protein